METSTNLKFILARPEEDGGDTPSGGGGDTPSGGGGDIPSGGGSDTPSGGGSNTPGGGGNSNVPSDGGNSNNDYYGGDSSNSSSGSSNYYPSGQTIYTVDDSSVAVPNTGENTASSSSVQSAMLPIFISLFILIVLAGIAHLVIKRKKSHLKFSDGDFKLNLNPVRVSVVSIAVLAVAFLGVSIFNHVYIEKEGSAEAASSLSISSLGNLEIKAEDHFDDSTFIYIAKDVVKVTSVGTNGYRVFAEAASDKLYLDGDSSKDYFSPAAGNKLQDGTWGYHTGNSSNWSAVPNTITNIATIPAVTSGTNSSETEIYYGINPSNNLKNGTYSTKITYSAVADEPAPEPGPVMHAVTINQGSNITTVTGGGTYEVGKTVTISATAADEHEFSSWTVNSGEVILSPDNNTSPATFVMPDSDVTITANAAAIEITMQNVDIAKLAAGETTTLPDVRDHQEYSVYRWPTSGAANTDYPLGMAGYAIMTKDLALGYITGGSITKGTDLILDTTSSAGSGTIAVRTGVDDWSSDYNNTNLQYTNGPQSGKEEYTSQSYYSFDAAQIACPKGWRLPTNQEYERIQAFMGGNNANGSAKIRGAPYNFIYGGNFWSEIGWNEVGEWGTYWGSTTNSSIYGGEISFSANKLGVASITKDIGLSVRCIKEYDTYMQDLDVSLITPNATSALRDKRDHQEYTVYRWPNTGTAGADYPIGLAGAVIMTRDLALGYITGGSVIEGTDLILDETDSAGSGAINARTSASDWEFDTPGAKSQYINGSQAGEIYYTGNRGYYSFDAAQIACPRGWRLPTSQEYKDIKTFMGSGSTAVGKITNQPYNFDNDGGFFSTEGWKASTISYEEHMSFYWASTTSTPFESHGIELDISSSSVETGAITKSVGLNVRCIRTETAN